jgi:nitroreductase
MVSELHLRSEELTTKEVLNLFVETPRDRDLVEKLKNRTPVVLRGSRGVGKSFLMRVAEAELAKEFPDRRILPAYVSFRATPTIQDPSPSRYLAWMISRICNRIVRASSSFGLSIPEGSALNTLTGAPVHATRSPMERLEEVLEAFWRKPSKVNFASIPDADMLAEAMEDICEHANLERIILFVDEAAHNFAPEQQRQFFTLMRDLRTPYLTIKAAVYPGATFYGDTFEPTHDALMLVADRDLLDDSYLQAMRTMAIKQKPDLAKMISQYGEVFDAMAFASTGNPRTLFTSISLAGTINGKTAPEAIRRYYRDGVWAEHSGLAKRYPGHRLLIDWGRQFMEDNVLPSLRDRNARRNVRYSHIWVHRDAPPAVQASLRLLCYSGILQEGPPGLRGASGVGSRYLVNAGCQLALVSDPISYATELRQNFDVRRTLEFGPNHSSFKVLLDFDIDDIYRYASAGLNEWLEQPTEVLQLTDFQRRVFRSLGLKSIRDVFDTDEAAFIQVRYVGKIRSKQMKDAAIGAALEYLSG